MTRDLDQDLSHSTAAVNVPPQTLRRTLQLIRSDMLARANYENKRLGAVQIAKFMLNTSVVATMLYRWQQFFVRPGCRWIAGLLRFTNAVWLTVDIDPDTRIDSGLFLMHANFICIGPGVRIGRNCVMAHQNSIQPACFHEAGRLQRSGGPTLGDDVMLGAGACVSGAVTLGDRIRVSINAAVEDSFPDDVTLFGVPARMRGRQAAATVED